MNKEQEALDGQLRVLQDDIDALRDNLRSVRVSIEFVRNELQGRKPRPFRQTDADALEAASRLIADIVIDYSLDQNTILEKIRKRNEHGDDTRKETS